MIEKFKTIKIGILGDNDFYDYKKIERILKTFIRKYEISHLNEYFSTQIDTKFKFIIGRENNVEKYIKKFCIKFDYEYEIIKPQRKDPKRLFDRDVQVWEKCDIGFFIANFENIEKNKDFSIQILRKLKRKVLLYDYSKNKYKYLK